MSWVCEFHPAVYKELGKLDPELRRQVLARLKSRLIRPDVPKARLSGYPSNTYKIKLNKAGLRIVYQIRPDLGRIRVLAIGRRDSDVYEQSQKRGSSDS